jgi:hypothetical protein
MLSAAALAALPGTAIPGGRWTLRPHENWLAHDALYSAPADAPHPVLAFVGAQRGLGVPVAGLFVLFGTAMEEGPLLTDCTIELAGELRVGIEYRVTGQVLAAERKTGRRLGVFDLVTARFSIAEPATGEPVATVTNTYALRRSG